MHRRAVQLILVLAMWSAAATVRAQAVDPPKRPARVRTAADSVLDARTAAVASTLRCPVCQGESIQDSPAELAQEMRDLVRDQLSEGKTPDEIRAYFVSKYGEWILLEPAMTGLNVFLYVFPVLLIGGGLALITVLVRRWSAPDPTSPTPHVNESDAGS